MIYSDALKKESMSEQLTQVPEEAQPQVEVNPADKLVQWYLLQLVLMPDTIECADLVAEKQSMLLQLALQAVQGAALSGKDFGYKMFMLETLIDNGFRMLPEERLDNLLISFAHDEDIRRLSLGDPESVQYFLNSVVR